MLRSDAVRNRATLLEVAESVFTEHGPDAPLTLITEQAGLGRGTLYRHFPNRVSIVSAIYGARLERYRDYALAHIEDPEVLFEVLTMVAWDQFAIPGLFRIIHANSEEEGPVADLWVRTQEVFEIPLDASKKAGAVRPDASVHDIFIAISMVYGVANSPIADRQGRTAIDRAIVLIRRMLVAN